MLFSLFTAKQNVRSSQQQRRERFKQRQARRSFLETLEDRSMMSTLTWVGDNDANWNTNNVGNTNWSGDALPADGDTLIFAGAAAGTLNNDTTAGNSYSLQFTAAGYTINGNSITLDNAGGDVTDNSGNTINTALLLDAASTASITAGNTTLGGVISGAGGALTKIGVGTLTLNNANLYSGGTTLTAGTIIDSSAGGLGTGSVANAGILNLTGGAVTYTFAGMSGAGTTNFTLGVGAAITAVSVGSYATYTGAINVGVGAAAGAGKLQIANMATLPATATINVLTHGTVFASAGTFAPPITLNGGDTGESFGQLRLEGATYNGSVTLAGAIVGAGDSFIGTNAGTGTIGGIIGESGGAKTLSKGGAGTTQLTNANTYSGGTNIVAGVLSVGSGGATGALGAGAVTISGTLLVNRSNAISISNAISSPGAGILRKLGAGTLTFTTPGGGNVFKTINLDSNSTIDFGSGNTTINNAGGATIQSAAAAGSLNLTINATGGTLLLGSAGVADGGNIGTANATVLTINAVMNTLVAGNAFELFQVANGTGIVVLTATNLFSGPVFINSGFGSVATIGASGVPSNLGSGATINIATGTSPPTLRYTGSGESTNRVVNLSGLINSSAIEDNGTGALTFTGNFTATGVGSKTLILQGSATGANAGRINGNIVNNSGVNITSLTKAGAGQWILAGANTYTGTTLVQSGTLLLGASNTINAGNAVTVTATGAGVTATLDLNGNNQTVGTLTLGGSTTTSAPVVTGAGTLTSTADIVYVNTNNPLGGILSTTTLDLNGGAPRIVNVGNSTSAANDLTISSVIQNGGLQKDGVGTLQFSGASANTYAGDTTVNDGTLLLNKTAGVNAIAGGTLAIGNGGANDSDIALLNAANQIADGVNVRVNNSGLFNLNANSETIAGLTLFTGTGIGGSVTTGAATLTLGANVAVNNTAGTDTTSADITGNLDLGGVTRTFTVSDATVVIDANIIGVISNGGLTKAGPGLLALTGATSNTYVGDTTVNDGTLALGKTVASIAVQGNVFIGDGVGVANSAVLQLGGTGGNQIANTADVTTAADGRLNMNGVNETIDALTGTGNVNSGIAGPAILTVGANDEPTFAFAGAISNGTGTVALTKIGTGLLSLNGANTYTGNTIITAGQVNLNGTLTSNITVNGTSILGGTGSSTGTMQSNNTSHIAPGISTGATVGRLTTGATILTVNSNLDIELAGTAGAGVAGGNDQLQVNGITLSAANLNLSGAVIPTPGTLQVFTIINNTSVSPIPSRLTYLGNLLEEGEFLNFNGEKLFISYVGGDGNDVTLSSQLMGSAIANLVIINPVSSTSISYSIDGGTTFYTTDGVIPRFTFNAGAGDDVMLVNLNGNPLPAGGLFYNGETQNAPLTAGANSLHGDVLSVVDASHTFTATYAADGVVNPLLDNDGTVTVLGQGVINFTGLEPVDMAGLLNANVTLPNANDVVTLTNGSDAATNINPALVVSGTSGGVPFEAVHLIGNTNVSINTTTVDGNDTVTVASASNAHGNTNLTINTGVGTDSVTFTGNATFAGNVTVTSQNIAFNGGLLTASGGTGVILNAGTGAVTTNGVGVDIATGNLSVTATTGIDLDTNVAFINPANNTGAGNIRFDELNGVTLSSITAANGSTIVNAAGTVNVTSVTSSTDTDANDISITTTVGNIVVTTITTGGTASDVTLLATIGSIIDNVNDAVTDITGDVLTLTAALGVGESAGNGSLDTAANALDVSVTGTGLIMLNELNAVTLTAVDTVNGPITILAGGAILATSVVSTTDNDANDISITATTGDISIVSINAGTVAGDVFVTASGGNLIDQNNDTIVGIAGIDITGDRLTLIASGDIGQLANRHIDTRANSLDSTSNSGAVAGAHGTWINEFDAITVVSAITTDGVIVITSAGSLTATSANAGGTGRNMFLHATAGSILLGSVTAAGDGIRLMTDVGAITDTNGAANNITTNNLQLQANTSSGTSADPLESNVVTLAATSTLGNLYLNEFDDLIIDTVALFGPALSGLNVLNGITVVNSGFPIGGPSPSGTLTVKKNVTGGGDVSLISNETIGANDTVAIDNSLTIRSTAGDLTLGFGDNETLNATHTLDVGPLRTINILSNDTDNGSTIQLQGIISARTVNVAGAGNNDFFILKADTVFDTNPLASTTILNLIGNGGNDTFGNVVDRINPTNARIEINGGTPNLVPVGDSLFLDASVLAPPVVFFAGKDQGFLDGGDATFRTVHYQQIENLTFYDNGLTGANSGFLSTVDLGALYVRGTPGDDSVNFIRSGTVNSTDVTAIIKWAGNQKYFGPYPMGAIDPSGKIVVYGKEGNDRITSSLSGGAATSNRDVEFHGGTGDDYLVGGTGNALMIGDEGNDSINTSSSLPTNHVVIWGDAEGSFDNNEVSSPGSGDPDGNDNIITGAGPDTIYGGGGNDTIASGAGDDIIYGGAGSDKINGNDGNDLIRGSSGEDIISGDAGDDVILGGDGNDKLYGRAGNDILIGGNGNDIISGEDGNDVVTGGLANAYNEQATLAATQALDTALLALLATWTSTNTFSATITDDGIFDNVLSGTGNDLLYVHEDLLNPAVHDTNDFLAGNDVKVVL